MFSLDNFSLSLDQQRLAKACSELQSGAYSVEVTQASDILVYGTVHGPKAAYHVTLGVAFTRCDCADFRFAKGGNRTCKHICMLALAIANGVEEKKALTTGDTVERDGVKGRVVAVSGDSVSVAWQSGRIYPVSREQVRLAA